MSYSRRRFSWFVSFPWDAVPYHEVSMHCGMRFRLHHGSSQELEYVLRTFGVDVSGELFRERSQFQVGGDLDESIEEDISRRQQLDEAWRQSEAPYRDPTSPTALFPNSQDIIMGRNKMVALAWPGNMMFHKVIQQYVYRYMKVQDSVSGRASKTAIAVEILHLLQDQHMSRFLARETIRWVVVDDHEARTKISQLLRTMAREIGTTMKR